jgi:hypothetical protein
VNRFTQIEFERCLTVAVAALRSPSKDGASWRTPFGAQPDAVSDRVYSSSRRRDDGRPAAANEAYVQNLAGDRRAKPGREMQRRAIMYGPKHGLGERGIVRSAAARSRVDDSRLADDGAVPREAGANRDLIVIMWRPPAGGDPCRDAVNACDQRLRLGGRCLRPERERDERNRGEPFSRPT